MRIRLTAAAAADLQETASRYDGFEAGVGADFLRAFDDVVERLQMFPSGAPPVDGLRPGVRRARMRRFPYGVFYFQGLDELIVLRVLHSKRDHVDELESE